MNCIFDCVNYDVIAKDYQLFGNIYENMLIKLVNCLRAPMKEMVNITKSNFFICV